MMHLPGDFESRTLQATLDRCAGKHVMVIGDLMLDEYVTGSVERISPEAPVPVVRASTSELRLGGAANVAQQIAALGAQVSLVGIIGKDAAGESLKQFCQGAGISTRNLVAAEQRRTTRKLRVLGPSQQLLRIDWEDRDPLSERDTGALLDAIGSLEAVDAIILSDYAKGTLSLSVIAAVMSARTPGTPIVVDPKCRDFSRYRGATLLTPNLRELAEAVGHSLDPLDMEAISAAARQALVTGGFPQVVVTLGDRGILVVEAHGPACFLPAQKRAVYDVTGAGDTAVAVLTTCLASGASLIEAAHLANIAAGITVGEVGAVAVPASRLSAELSGSADSKVFTQRVLQSRLVKWRAAGERIVFTNGCFDLLHPGHLSLLSFAKSLGDRLVLAINSDAAVRSLKGPTRPVVSQHDRAAMLGALNCVDAVVIFDQDTPLEIINIVQPDVLVKGQDYRLDEVIGRKLVEAAGGRVVLAPLLAQYSTTSLLARLRA